MSQQVARKKTRKFLFQKLYARLFWEVDDVRFHESFFQDIFEYTIDNKYLDEMFQLIIDHQKYVLCIINTYAPKFDIETMNKANILAISIGICEMKFLKEEIPVKVSINEAVEMAKVYGDESSKKIVNGILNSYLKNFDSHTDVEENSQFEWKIF